MRILLTLVVWGALIGGLWLYMNTRRDMGALPADSQVITGQETKNLTVVITTTFTLARNPFAFTADDAPPQNFILRLNGVFITFPGKELKPGEPYHLSHVPVMADSHNELFFQTSYAYETNREHAVRLQVILGGKTVAEKTFWSQGGTTISGTMTFIPGKEAKHDHT
ncbi:MAG: hypothetical protein CSA32_03730 [Desulfobulbus propionicus]|nr:MAG: hypothetical protein CSA32_03730 [Desulfobulbus propionicus]